MLGDTLMSSCLHVLLGLPLVHGLVYGHLGIVILAQSPWHGHPGIVTLALSSWHGHAGMVTLAWSLWHCHLGMATLT